MSDDFLSRWSRRKVAARTGEPPPPAPPPAAAPAAAPAASAAAGAPPPGANAAPVPLPPVESLTFDSDFSPFMQAGVDAVLRRTALKTLLNDPRFNVMDGLDVYIDDYSKPDPLPPGWLERLTEGSRLGDYAPIQEAQDRAAREAAALQAAETAAQDPGEGAAQPPAAPESAAESDTSGEGSRRAQLPESDGESAPG